MFAKLGLVGVGVGVAGILLVGLLGCTQAPSGQAERVRLLEQRYARLEEENRAAAVTRDQLQSRLKLLEDEKQVLLRRLAQHQAAVRERDELRQQLAQRTAERDTLAVQFDNFRTALRTLVSDTERQVNLPAISAAAPAPASLPAPSPLAPAQSPSGETAPVPPSTSTGAVGTSAVSTDAPAE
jgi:septal ring factor EnvC (AmiA/AmiB activator)